jgi:hypothetical protein
MEQKTIYHYLKSYSDQKSSILLVSTIGSNTYTVSYLFHNETAILE